MTDADFVPRFVERESMPSNDDAKVRARVKLVMVQELEARMDEPVTDEVKAKLVSSAMHQVPVSIGMSDTTIGWVIGAEWEDDALWATVELAGELAGSFLFGWRERSSGEVFPVSLQSVALVQQRLPFLVPSGHPVVEAHDQARLAKLNDVVQAWKRSSRAAVRASIWDATHEVDGAIAATSEPSELERIEGILESAMMKLYKYERDHPFIRVAREALDG